jgi:hypothetical protein
MLRVPLLGGTASADPLGGLLSTAQVSLDLLCKHIDPVLIGRNSINNGSHSRSDEPYKVGEFSWNYADTRVAT